MTSRRDEAKPYMKLCGETLGLKYFAEGKTLDQAVKSTVQAQHQIISLQSKYIKKLEDALYKANAFLLDPVPPAKPISTRMKGSE